MKEGPQINTDRTDLQTRIRSTNHISLCFDPCLSVQICGLGSELLKLFLGVFATRAVKQHATAGQQFLNTKSTSGAIAARHELGPKRHGHSRPRPNIIASGLSKVSV